MKNRVWDTGIYPGPLHEITSKGYGIEWGSQRCPEGFIEFHHKRKRETFWRLTLAEAVQYLGEQ